MRKVPYRGKLRQGKFSSGKNIRHLLNFSSLFPDENFPWGIFQTRNFFASIFVSFLNNILFQGHSGSRLTTSKCTFSSSVSSSSLATIPVYAYMVSFNNFQIPLTNPSIHFCDFPSKNIIVSLFFLQKV